MIALKRLACQGKFVFDSKGQTLKKHTWTSFQLLGTDSLWKNLWYAHTHTHSPPKGTDLWKFGIEAAPPELPSTSPPLLLQLLLVDVMTKEVHLEQKNLQIRSSLVDPSFQALPSTKSIITIKWREVSDCVKAWNHVDQVDGISCTSKSPQSKIDYFFMLYTGLNFQISYLFCKDCPLSTDKWPRLKDCGPLQQGFGLKWGQVC